MGYKVLSNIRHNLKDFHPGDVIDDISEEAANELIALKVLASNVEGQVAQDVQTAQEQVQTDASTIEGQVASDIQESLQQIEEVKNQPAEAVTTGSVSAATIAAEAAQIK